MKRRRALESEGETLLRKDKVRKASVIRTRVSRAEGLHFSAFHSFSSDVYQSYNTLQVNLQFIKGI